MVKALLGLNCLKLLLRFDSILGVISGLNWLSFHHNTEVMPFSTNVMLTNIYCDRKVKALASDFVAIAN